MLRLGGIKIESIKSVCHRGFLMASGPLGCENPGSKLWTHAHVRMSLVFEARGPFDLVIIGQRSLEGAMNVHVYTQPG